MEIKLIINGEEKIYNIDFVSARMLRKAFELISKLEELEEATATTISGEMFDKISAFFVALFNNQFTADEFENGIPAHGFMEYVGEQLGMVVGFIGEESKN